MGLDAFKVIYWWEWSHRPLARLTGVVFLFPFLFFSGALSRQNFARGVDPMPWISRLSCGAMVKSFSGASIPALIRTLVVRTLKPQSANRK
jgi:heme A synthase